MKLGEYLVRQGFEVYYSYRSGRFMISKDNGPSSGGYPTLLEAYLAYIKGLED